MRKKRFWKEQLEMAEEAGDETYTQHCLSQLKHFIDEEDIEEDEDEWEDEFFWSGDGVTVELYPNRVGHWEIGSGLSKMVLPQDKKPNPFHRFFSKLLLGWEWVDK